MFIERTTSQRYRLISRCGVAYPPRRTFANRGSIDFWGDNEKFEGDCYTVLAFVLLTEQATTTWSHWNGKFYSQIFMADSSRQGSHFHHLILLMAFTGCWVMEMVNKNLFIDEGRKEVHNKVKQKHCHQDVSGSLRRTLWQWSYHLRNYILSSDFVFYQTFVPMKLNFQADNARIIQCHDQNVSTVFTDKIMVPYCC